MMGPIHCPGRGSHDLARPLFWPNHGNPPPYCVAGPVVPMSTPAAARSSLVTRLPFPLSTW